MLNHFASLPSLLAASPDLIATVPDTIATGWAQSWPLIVRPLPLDMQAVEVCLYRRTTTQQLGALDWLYDTVVRAVRGTHGEFFAIHGEARADAVIGVSRISVERKSPSGAAATRVASLPERRRCGSGEGGRMVEVTAVSASARRNAAHGGTLVVTGRREVAHDVVELRLARPEGERLPDWAPGAHIDIVLPDGTTRQYSLLGDRWDAHSFTIAVLRERGGRGGSEYIHTRLAVGDTVGFGGPRNNFRLSPAPDYLFIAGGIGITPLVPMIRQAELLDDPWRLLYLGRSRSRPGLPRRTRPRFGDRVTIHTADELGRA